jgi:hypothetical protein
MNIISAASSSDLISQVASTTYDTMANTMPIWVTVLGTIFAFFVIGEIVYLVRRSRE